MEFPDASVQPFVINFKLLDIITDVRMQPKRFEFLLVPNEGGYHGINKF